ncbi:hypothetical protein [Polaribacter sp. AHE13PA]|uniref:hypothetical protein n=1 Tax=Polaribacter sp. AHE13PA TaxID=2745562 RepID=UPI001C4F6505|nr:hypothetical protein [Polaribacter sp. AHE13PA]QXP67520.1 hypothetical protein H0I28_03190 [Polaribacter sp. AHE13PA]
MKIKIKGTDQIKDISPSEWSGVEKNGQSSEYEIIERNTVWATPIDNNGNIIESQKREFELEHWQRILGLGSKNKWKRFENGNNEFSKTNLESEIIENSETNTKANTEIIELSQLQVELTQAQIDESKAQKKFIELQTSDLKYKYLYFIIGIILGNLGTVLLWIQWLNK